MQRMLLSKKFCIMSICFSVLLITFFWINMEILSLEGRRLLKTAKGIPINVKNKLCHVNYTDNRYNNMKNNVNITLIYFVTPTYPRPEQIPELTRLGHTLMHVQRIHWIVADDQPLCSMEIFNLLRRTGLPFTHIASPKPYIFKDKNFPRGVANRRAALNWLRENAQDGVIYFGDDDNTIDLQLFNEIRQTKKVSMFPVGLIGGFGVSTPIVKDGKIVAFFDSWPGARMFPVDMAGFAVNINFLKPSATMPYSVGHEEDEFLISLGLKLEDIEPLADNCSKILVWHTKTVKFNKPSLKMDIDKIHSLLDYENFAKLMKEINRLGMANIFPDNGTQIFIIKNRKTYEPLIGFP